MSEKPRPRWLRYALHPFAFTAIALALATLLIGLDRESTSQLHDYMRPYDSWLQLFTFLGDGRVLLPACIVLAIGLALARSRARLAPLGAGVCVIVSGLTTDALKMVFGRPRPYTETDVRYLQMPADALHWFTTNYDFESFPSGHSTAVFSLAWYVVMATKDRRAQAAALVIAALVALTRVALYKHYFADTLAGAAVGVGMTELLATVFGLANRPGLLRLGRRAKHPHPPILSLAAAALVAATAAAGLSGCSSVKSRIGEHEGEFASYPPQTQAQIQSGRIDKGFSEEMVYMALGEPALKETETSKDGRTTVTWKYPKPASLLDTTASPSSMAAPYGYPGPATGPAQPVPMFYERKYYKVKFQGGQVVDWDDDLQEKSPPPLGNGH